MIVMAKANRSFEAGWGGHLTHRCHDRAFLLRFARDRDTYRSMLRGRLQRYGVPLLGQDPASESFRANYRAAVERALGLPEGSTRQACWTSLAVGSADFLSEAEARQGVRISRVPVYDGNPEGTWALQEEAASYA